ncbi:MAG: penicillin-insensitive murein endopeptidase [Gaiellaceae bacterium]
MAWRRGEIWFDAELRWFREASENVAASLELNAPAFAGLTPAALGAGVPNGLAESRRRRAELRRRRGARKTRAAALVIGPAVLMSVAAPRLSGASRAGEPLDRDPPSQTLRPGGTELGTAESPVRAQPLVTRETAPTFPAIEWARATSQGLPYAGSLSDGTQLPVEGVDWVTWNPNTDRVPNKPHRLYGNERVIRKLVAALAAYRAENPDAPRVVVGDISFREGGPMDQHRSHQNGLDVDVYYPRRDGALLAPTSAAQVDRKLAQDILDRFVAAGAQMVFVGYATGFRGPGDVVIPYPHHEDHMHVRFRKPQS